MKASDIIKKLMILVMGVVVLKLFGPIIYFFVTMGSFISENNHQTNHNIMINAGVKHHGTSK